MKKKSKNISFLLLVACGLLSLVLLSPFSLYAGKEDKIAEVVEMTSKAIVNIKTEEWSKDIDEKKKPNVFRKLIVGDEEEDDDDDNGESETDSDYKPLFK